VNNNSSSAASKDDPMQAINEFRANVKDIEILNENYFSNPVNQKLLCNTLMYQHVLDLIRYDVEVNTQEQKRIKKMDAVLEDEKGE
jgi:hypothetical protein